MPLSNTSGLKSGPEKFRGQGALSRLDDILPRYKNILLFCDRDAFEPCGAAEYFRLAVEKFKDSSRFQYVSYAGKALPIEDIEEKYREVKTNTGVDLIIAVGGGTIIDMAKIVSIAYSNTCGSAAEILPPQRLKNNLDLLFVPTTAGTGSEATSFAVVYRDRVKLSIDDQSVLPRFVVLDPLLLRSLPKPVLYSTVLDALAQAVESIWARGGTAESQEYAAQAIPLIMEHLTVPLTVEVLGHFQWASHLAGQAINISRTTLPHSISYPVTSYFGVPHGIAVFLTLPRVAHLNYHAAGDTLQEGVTADNIRDHFELLFSLFGVNGIDSLQEQLLKVMENFGFSTRLRDYGIDRGDLELLADNALTKGRSDNNPRKVDRKDILNLLAEIF